MSLSDKQAEFAVAISRLIIWCHEQGFKVTKGEAERKQVMQDWYLDHGKTTVKHSRHQDKLAQDLNRLIGNRLAAPEEYRVIGEKWESMGGRWGGRFGVKKENYDSEIGWDPEHFERRK